ncbi:MAG: hypothetical protein JWM11_570 [Planctomycetaceae bacterium]|nr:hypothetical protein [Planctomycetaceae bacterium]
MTQLEWLTSESPYDMLRHLDGKIKDEAFMKFSVKCCRRIWPILTDPRSRAVVEATEAYLSGNLSAADAAKINWDWNVADEAGEIQDSAGGSSNAAIESVCGLGEGHAQQVAIACRESSGIAASDLLRQAGCPQDIVIDACKSAMSAEKVEQCNLLRELFRHHPGSLAEGA